MNPSCVVLTCSAKSMAVTIRSNAFGTLTLAGDAQTFEHNSQTCDSNPPTFNADEDTFTFDINFGDCGMVTEMKDDKINFAHQIKPVVDMKLQGGDRKRDAAKT